MSRHGDRRNDDGRPRQRNSHRNIGGTLFYTVTIFGTGLMLGLHAGRRRAPERQGADPVTREAYSHECSSVGFWPGGGEITGPACYSYTSPAPDGYAEYRVLPAAAFYHGGLGEVILMYDDLRRAGDPKAALLDFCQTTYEAGANLAHWDREAFLGSIRKSRDSS